MENYENNSTVVMNTIDTLSDESNNAVIVNTLETLYEPTTLKTDCEVNTLDPVCAGNTLETPFQVSSLETISFERNSTVRMNTLDTPLEMNTLETACAINTLDTALEMNTLDTACTMDTQDTAIEMNTLDTARTKDTQDTAIEMNTLDTARTMDTQDTAFEMNTLDTACTVDTAFEVNTFDTAHTMNTVDTAFEEMNTLDTTYEMNTLKTITHESDNTVAMNTLNTACEMNTVETVADKSNNTLTINALESTAKSIHPEQDDIEILENGNTHTSTSTLKRVTTTEASDGESLCKKVKLESFESVENSQNICSLSVLPKEEKVKSNADLSNVCEISSSNQKYTTDISKQSAAFNKSCEETDCRRDKADGAAKPSPLTEIQAGITEYLGTHKGFSAVIKQRYSDFIVNEIDMQGNVVHLTQMESPESLDEEPASENNVESEITSDIISSEDITRIESLIKSSDHKATVNIVAPVDKDSRSKIHLAIKKKYPQLETKTAEVDSQKMIQVMWKTGMSQDRNKDNWPESKKEYKYVKFVLYKENKDTMDAIGLIAKNLKVKEGLFQFAGTKDKRAKTSQEITAQRIHPKKLSFMNKVLWNIGLGNFKYVKEPLKLGQLSGNQFTIVLRNVQETNENVDSAISSLKTLGFVNYFGMQRFGTTLVPTHKVGCALLHGDWEKAVDLILMPRDDNPSKDAFQKVWMETKDPEATLKVTPSYCGLERNLLEALRKKMKPFNALEKISRNTRLLYVHSYQALVWNQIVSKRLKVFGFKPIIGDLVQTEDSDSTESSPPVLVSQDNLDKFSLHHVILPLPGHDVVYPKNEVYNWYRETLAADGIDIDNMKRPQKDYSLPGAYRHITVCPTDVSWTHHRYDDYSLPLTLSDMETIKGNTLPDSHNKGKFKAVVLRMNLSTSSYATMALREILHVDTSVAHQTSLNVT